LLALGWAAALRRSELIGLKLRTGSGFVELGERGVLVTLPTSIGSLEAAEEMVCPTPTSQLPLGFCAAGRPSPS
jgi:hypothetical protein